MFFWSTNGSQQPIGDNARKGAVKKRTQLKNPADEDIDEAQQEGRAVHGRQEERQEV